MQIFRALGALPPDHKTAPPLRIFGYAPDVLYCVETTSVRRIFEMGVQEILRRMKTKRKISPLRISPFFCPKLGEDKKKVFFTQI